MPDNCEITDSIESADVIFSIIYDKIFSKSFLEKKRCFNFTVEFFHITGAVIPAVGLSSIEKMSMA